MELASIDERQEVEEEHARIDRHAGGRRSDKEWNFVRKDAASNATWESRKSRGPKQEDREVREVARTACILGDKAGRGGASVAVAVAVAAVAVRRTKFWICFGEKREKQLAV
jgi:hypothetical protein